MAAGSKRRISPPPANDPSYPLLMSRRCELLDNPRLIRQFADLERKTARAEKDSISHPPNSHADGANAVCGALLMAGTGRPPMKISRDLADRLALTPYPGTEGWRRMQGARGGWASDASSRACTTGERQSLGEGICPTASLLLQH